MTDFHHGVSDESEIPAAAILDDGSVDADALLAAVAEVQRRAGRRVRGLVMTRPDGNACVDSMVLVDVEARDTYLVSQRLGSGATSCRVDPQGFAHASRVLRRALAEAPDLVVVNRFGGLESAGGGFAAEMLELMVCGVPMLTVVSTQRLAAWERFSGGATVLPATAAVSAWVERTLQSRACAAAAD
jgi:nucleoside-triphosphatase THEP1